MTYTITMQQFMLLLPSEVLFHESLGLCSIAHVNRTNHTYLSIAVYKTFRQKLFNHLVTPCF